MIKLLYIFVALMRLFSFNKLFEYVKYSNRVKLYKTKNSLIIYIRTEKINIRVYLYLRKVLRINLFNYDCGWIKQIIKYILIFYIIWTKLKNYILIVAELLNYRKIVSSVKELKTAAKIIINIKLLN